MKPGELVDLYARVSTPEQDAAPQLVRLREWAKRQELEVGREFIEVASGRLVRRPMMDECLARVKGRHTRHVAVVKLDRWGRSLIDVKKSVQEMAKAGVGFHAIESGLTYEKDTAAGTFFLTMLGAVAEFEAGLISERTKEGLVGKVGKGRHVKGCGTICPCPSGAHAQTKGMPVALKETASETGGLPNDRLIGAGNPPATAGGVAGVQPLEPVEPAKDLEVAKGPEAV